MLERSEVLRNHVTVLRQCNDTELAALLAEARALLFPSFAEGFGLPVAEALAAGVPVIASELPVLREVAADVPDYLDPLHAPQWMDRIVEYARSGSELRAAQLQRIRGFQSTTWEGHFRIVDDFLATLGADVRRAA